MDERVGPAPEPKAAPTKLPLSERVQEVARLAGNEKHPTYQHYYTCPEHGSTELPCHHWWGLRGYGTPHKPRQEKHKRKQQRSHRGRKPRADMVVTFG